ncbi:protein Daple isoform X1 [Oryzias melastigma]|uniref:protein Daple isoform X1 n=1 Tax=Oryzias melastigma TaxID=30732 RepID=UPI000CF7CBDC|nr:protein Daple isoform X1 [Oryzias melastigma]
MDKPEDGELQESIGGNLIVKLRRLQKGNQTLEGEIKELKQTSDSLQNDLEALHSQSYQLEKVYKEKEVELCRKVQFQCDKSEQDFERELKDHKMRKDLLEQNTCEIQEFKLKHRKLRMRFENQLQHLMEKHKKLHCVFAPERLPDELERAENKKTQLLSVEQLKLAQLQKLEEEIEAAKKKKQLETETAQYQDK